MKNKYDVVLMGGGLAGLTLAMQIKKAEPAISIAILEMRNNDAPESAHKVGESTVELGTYYLREILGLGDYLDERHLHKHGLRFYFSPEVKDTIDKRVEYGARNELFVPSHQIDRGVFENDMAKMVIELGVDFVLGSRVLDLDLSEDGHNIIYKQQGLDKKLKATWVVDATGRANLIKRKKGLHKEITHDINAVWFRVEGEIDVEKWSDNEEWQRIINPGLRRLGTVHFMGKGYWVWFIPLGSGNTSIGIVADPRFHDFSDFNSVDNAYDWLHLNEPQCAIHLEEKRTKVLDFKRLKKYSSNTTQFYSEEKWGLIGEAGAFLDPFYSPGTDFISIGNTWMCDLITRDFKGEDVYTRSIIYDKVHSKLFENWIPVYQEKYELFDNAQVMSFKITWDFAVYWGIPSLLFTNNGLTNMKVLKAIFTSKNSLGERFGKLNKQMQDFYLDWGRIENKTFTHAYIDPMDVPFVKKLQKGLEEIHSSEDILVQKLEDNLHHLEMMAAQTFRDLSARIKGTPENMPVDPYTMSLKTSKEKLIEQSTLDGVLELEESMRAELSALWLDEKISN